MATEQKATPLGGLDTRSATPLSLARCVAGETEKRDRSGELVADRYRVVRRLGAGGMGSVWLAVDCVLGRFIALKELRRPATAGEVDMEGRALCEARAAAAVCHPGVVQVYDVVVSDGREWIVMEALAGSTLAQAIGETGGVPLEILVPIALRLVEALQAIHGQGVIHGDIKPGNIQLASAGRPVLIDFGLATSTEVGGVTSPYYAGSPPYMAPETIRTGIRSHATDLFALGVTLYEAAEGRRPFDDATPAATALAVLRECPKPALPGTPIGQVIDGLLVKDPRHRLGLRDAYSRLRAIAPELERLDTTNSSPAPTARF